MTEYRPSQGSQVDPIRLYWWANKKNFGDLIGPWLVEMMCGAPAVNVRGSAGREVGLATVGSLIQSLDRSGLAIWGSGAICSLKPAHVSALADKQPSAVHALRGWRTHKEVTAKLGWKAPRIFGDPALLLPRFYAPSKRSDIEGRIAFVPHYTHKQYFETLDDERIRFVDVQQDPDRVVDEIAAASAVVSSSLHGIVVAQAYEIPWVWLRIRDDILLGGDFKFEDFFTVLARESVRAVTVDARALDADKIAVLAKFSFVPQNKFTFDDLLDSFPHDALVRGALAESATPVRSDVVQR